MPHISGRKPDSGWPLRLSLQLLTEYHWYLFLLLLICLSSEGAHALNRPVKVTADISPRACAPLRSVVEPEDLVLEE